MKTLAWAAVVGRVSDSMVSFGCSQFKRQTERGGWRWRGLKTTAYETAWVNEVRQTTNQSVSFVTLTGEEMNENRTLCILLGWMQKSGGRR